MPIVFPTDPGPQPPPHIRELVRLRRGTKRFIDADPREIVLWRSTKLPNGTGGWLTGVPLGIYEQTFRLIPQGSSTATENQKSEGTQRQPTWVLMGMHNAEMREGDRFFMPDGTVAQVVYVQEHRAYQTKGEVVLSA